MAEKRKCELYLLQMMPHALRDDSMTVGVVVVEVGGKFAEVRLTRDWRRVECFAPDLELEIFEFLSATIGDWLGEVKNKTSEPQGAQRDTEEIHRELRGLLEAKFGELFGLSQGKALLTADPAAEMRILERDYLAAMVPAEHGRGRTRHTGRLWIVNRMQDGFAAAGVLEMLQRDVEMTEFTGKNDPFKVDFGFRMGSVLKMFHGLALSLSRDPAVTLAYRFARIREGMRARGEEALLTAVISEAAMLGKGEVASGIGMLRANEIEVRGVEEMGEIAEEVRRKIRG